MVDIAKRVKAVAVPKKERQDARHPPDALPR